MFTTGIREFSSKRGQEIKFHTPHTAPNSIVPHDCIYISVEAISKDHNDSIHMPYTTEGDNHNRHITTPILVKSNPAYYRQTFLLSRDGLPLTRMAILTSFQGLVIIFTLAGNKMNRIDTMYHLKFTGRLRGSIINETYRIEVLSQLGIALSPTRPRPIITTEHEIRSAEITRACALRILAGPHMVVAPPPPRPNVTPDCQQQQATTKREVTYNHQQERPPRYTEEQLMRHVNENVGWRTAFNFTKTLFHMCDNAPAGPVPHPPLRNAFENCTFFHNPTDQSLFTYDLNETAGYDEESFLIARRMPITIKSKRVLQPGDCIYLSLEIANEDQQPHQQLQVCTREAHLVSKENREPEMTQSQHHPPYLVWPDRTIDIRRVALDNGYTIFAIYPREPIQTFDLYHSCTSHKIHGRMLNWVQRLFGICGGVTFHETLLVRVLPYKQLQMILHPKLQQTRGQTQTASMPAQVRLEYPIPRRPYTQGQETEKPIGHWRERALQDALEDNRQRYNV
ncbi:unnamed protein product [Sphagnum tenellum]